MQIPKQCGWVLVLVLMFAFANATNKLTCGRFSQNSWLSMWVRWVCLNRHFVVLVLSRITTCCRVVGRLVALGYISLWHTNEWCFRVGNCSFRRFAMHRMCVWLIFVCCVYRMHINGPIHYVHRHIFFRWLAAERVFFRWIFFLLASLLGLPYKGTILKWRVNASMGDSFFSQSHPASAFVCQPWFFFSQRIKHLNQMESDNMICWV